MSRLFFLLVMLVACSPSEFSFQSQPMKSEAMTDNKLTDVRVDLIKGPALPMAKLLSNSIASGLLDNGVTTSVEPRIASRFVLKGVAKANWKDKRVPFVMLIYWTLYDRSGKAVGKYTQGVRGARWKWEYGDPTIISAVGKGAAKPLAAMIAKEENNPEQNPLFGVGVLVKSVTGAPGDGNMALRDAIISELRGSDVKVIEDTQQASLTLTGHVSLQPKGFALEEVLVTWLVQTMDGFEVGRATQANKIPMAKLDGLWREEAKKIAAEALIGIKRIIGLKKTGKEPTVKTVSGEPMRTPDLEQNLDRTAPPLR